MRIDENGHLHGRDGRYAEQSRGAAPGAVEEALGGHQAEPLPPGLADRAGEKVRKVLDRAAAGDPEAMRLARSFFPADFARAEGGEAPRFTFADFPSAGSPLREAIDPSSPAAREWLGRREAEGGGIFDRADAAGGIVARSRSEDARGREVHLLRTGDGGSISVPREVWESTVVPAEDRYSIEHARRAADKARSEADETARRHGPGSRVESPAVIVAARRKAEFAQGILESIESIAGGDIRREEYADHVGRLRREAYEEGSLDASGRLRNPSRRLKHWSWELAARGRISGNLS